MFCKECVSTYEGRLLCAACLATRGPEGETRRRSSLVVAPIQLLGGIIALWLIINAAASLLSVVPSSFFDSAQSWQDYEPYVPEEEAEEQEAS